MVLFTILFYTGFISLASLAAVVLLSFHGAWNKRMALYLVNFAAGTLLAAAFFDLLPEAVASISSHTALSWSIFVGILFLFFSERFLLWFHHHHEPHERAPSWIFVNIGDSIHNFIDGIAIASSVIASPFIGLATAFAIFMHEVPQELADYTITVHGGVSRKRAIVINLITAAFAVLGGVAGYFLLHRWGYLTPYLVAFTTGNFIYIACADLIPELHTASQGRNKWMQTISFVSGIAVLLVTMQIAERIGAF